MFNNNHGSHWENFFNLFRGNSRLKKIFYIVVGMSLILCLIPKQLVANSNKTSWILLDPTQDIKEKIRTGKPGTVFLFQQGTYVLPQTIVIPSDVSLKGFGADTLIRSSYVSNLKTVTPVFDISNTKNVSIENLKIQLNNHRIGIRGKKVTNFLANKIIIDGNSMDIDNNKSRAAFWIEVGKDIKLLNNTMTDTVGGIYIIKGKNVEIQGNKLTRINSGNIVVGGEGIKILMNHMKEAGKGSAWRHPAGDGITITSGTSDVIVENNILESGYCYGLWAKPVTNLIIRSNEWIGGITTAVYLETAKKVLIENNTFISNLSHGVAIDKNYEDITIKNNVFYDNDLFLLSSGKNILVENNTFFSRFSSYLGGNITDRTNKAIMSKNVMNKFGKIGPKMEVVLKNKSQKIAKGTETIIKTDTPTMVFLIRNIGDAPLHLYGWPQILLSAKILSASDRGPRVSGDSKYGNFSVIAKNQPSKLSLLPEQEVEFSVTWDDNIINNSMAILNIPSNDESNKPFYTKIIADNSPNR